MDAICEFDDCYEVIPCIEIDQPGLIGLIKDRESAGDLLSAVRRFLSSCLLINEQHFNLHLNCESNRLVFSKVELRNVKAAVGRQDSSQPGGYAAQCRTGSGATGCFNSSSTARGIRIRVYNRGRISIWPIRTR